jgi:hypothetical protein
MPKMKWRRGGPRRTWTVELMAVVAARTRKREVVLRWKLRMKKGEGLVPQKTMMASPARTWR